MKRTDTPNKKSLVILSQVILIVLALFASFGTLAQVGIGTVSPDASSMLDIESTSKGFLAPRMTTVQKNAISTPVVGLMVFDTDLDKFYYYDGSLWVAIETNQNTRDNYVLVKSLSDLPTPSSGTITLVSGTLYEINGTIALGANSINLNGCVLFGKDPSRDILTYTGASGLFSGANGGHLEFLNIQGGGSAKLFNITDGTNTKNFIIQECYVSGFNNLGTISGHDFVFLNSIHYSNNTTGATFSGTNQLYLNNQIWNASNTGDAFTFNGTFDDISIIGGKINIDSGEEGLCLSSNPTVSNGLVQSVSFSGAGSYVDPYTTGNYTNYNFTNDWNVVSSGIGQETDSYARGDINLDASVGSGYYTYYSGTGTSSRKKLSGGSTSNNLFRFTKSGDNRIVYDGKIKRSFSITAAISFQGDYNNSIFIFYIAKNGAVVEDTKVYREVGENYDVGAAAIVGAMELEPGDYIEVWGERFSGAGNTIVVSLNLIVN